MPTLGDVDFRNGLYSLYKGEPGTRKSTAALSLPKPQYWFSYDQKMEGLILPMRAWGVNPNDIHFDDYKDWNAAKLKLERFQTNCPYKTIVVDSITTLADAINRQTLKLKGKDDKGKTIASIPVNSIEDFNAEDSALKEMVALTKDIHKYHKINVVLIAHVIQKEIKTADGKTHMSRIIVTAGKGIAQKIPAYCTEVYHFNIKSDFDADSGGQYALKTTHTGDDFARTSLPLPAEITFGSENLYEKWIAPAIQRTVDDKQKSTQTTPSTPTDKPAF